MNYLDAILIIVSGLATIVTTILTIKKSNNMTNYRLEQIEKSLDKDHLEFGTFVARLFKCEEAKQIFDEKFKTQDRRIDDTNHRIDDLERKVQG